MTLRQIDRMLFSWGFDLLLLGLSLFVGAWLRVVLPLGPDYAPAAEVSGFIYILVGIIWTALFIFWSVYDLNIQSNSRQLSRIIGAHVSALLVLGVMLFLAWRDFSRYLFMYFAWLSLIALISWHWLSWKLFSRFGAHAQRTAILGTGPEAVEFYRRIVSQSHPPVQIIGFISADHADSPPRLPAGTRLLGSQSELREIVSREWVDKLVLALPTVNTRDMRRLVFELSNSAVRIYLYLDLANVVLVNGRCSNVPGHLINLSTPLISTHERVVKRILDWILTVPSLIVTVPLMIVIAIAIKLTSPGSIIFRQVRAGEFGYPFVLYKFRSMVHGAETFEQDMVAHTSDGTEIHKYRNDPRVTTVGRFLRRWSLDELPQLWNVLRGDMSLVGPRPELLWLVEQYKPEEYRRLLMPPGLTGWWQINGRSNRPLHLCAQDDLTYIENYSIWLDLWILFKTPFAILRGEGAF